MDLLSDVLKVVRLDSAIFFNAQFSEPWCLRTPDSGTIAPLVAPGSDHLIVYHLLCDGQAYVHLHDGDRQTLKPGDIVMFPHGHPHVLGAGTGALKLDTSDAVKVYQARSVEMVRLGGGGPESRFICGFLACDSRLSRAFLGGLPALLVVNIRDDASGQWLENSLHFSVSEAVRGRPGADAMLAKLSEVVFTETLRRYVQTLPEGETGWLAGTRDPGVARALAILHERFAEPWTVAGLAQQAGLSRTVLAERFRHFLGDPPMAYLTHWRLRVGARTLTTSSRSVAEVAAEVGYESEAAFNRAFKREYGLPPARYRKAGRPQPREALV
jgi:AraC-like DNA-binding protein